MFSYYKNLLLLPLISKFDAEVPGAGAVSTEAETQKEELDALATDSEIKDKIKLIQEVFNKIEEDNIFESYETGRDIIIAKWLGENPDSLSDKGIIDKQVQELYTAFKQNGAESGEIKEGVSSLLDGIRNEVSDALKEDNFDDEEDAADLNAKKDTIDGLDDKLLTEFKLKKALGKITGLEGDKTVLEGKITGLEGDKTVLEGKITGLEGDKTALEGKITGLEGDKTALEGKVTGLEGDKTALEGKVIGLELNIKSNEHSAGLSKFGSSFAEVEAAKDEILMKGMERSDLTVGITDMYNTLFEIQDKLSIVAGDDNVTMEYLDASIGLFNGVQYGKIQILINDFNDFKQAQETQRQVELALAKYIAKNPIIEKQQVDIKAVAESVIPTGVEIVDPVKNNQENTNVQESNSEGKNDKGIEKTDKGLQSAKDYYQRKKYSKDEMILIQQAVIDAGYNMPKFGADGDFGKESYIAITKFQEANNLDVDGKAGTDTLTALELTYDKESKKIINESSILDDSIDYVVETYDTIIEKIKELFADDASFKLENGDKIGVNYDEKENKLKIETTYDDDVYDYTSALDLNELMKGVDFNDSDAVQAKITEITPNLIKEYKEEIAKEKKAKGILEKSADLVSETYENTKQAISEYLVNFPDAGEIDLGGGDKLEVEYDKKNNVLYVDTKIGDGISDYKTTVQFDDTKTMSAEEIKTAIKSANTSLKEEYFNNVLNEAFNDVKERSRSTDIVDSTESAKVYLKKRTSKKGISTTFIQIGETKTSIDIKDSDTVADIKLKIDAAKSVYEKEYGEKTTELEKEVGKLDITKSVSSLDKQVVGNKNYKKIELGSVDKNVDDISVTLKKYPDNSYRVMIDPDGWGNGESMKVTKEDFNAKNVEESINKLIAKYRKEKY